MSTGKALFPLKYKVFFVISVIGLISTAIVTYQNSQAVYEILNRNFQSFSVNAAEKLSVQVETYMIRLDNEAFRVLQTTLREGKVKSQPGILGFFKRRKESVGLSFLRVKGGKIEIIQNNTILDKLPRGLKNFSWLTKQAKKFPQQQNFFNAMRFQNKPYILLSRRFDLKEGGTVFWSVTTIKGEHFNNLFTSSRRYNRSRCQYQARK